MTHPRRYLYRMAAFLVVLAAGLAFLIGGLRDSFMANPGFNGVILGVLALGIVYAFRIVTALGGDVLWLESFRIRRESGVAADAATTPRMLAPLAAVAGDRPERFSPSPAAARSLLDGVLSRLGEEREISRYLIGLLIFLGLLGTFWGLLKTIGAVGDVVAGLEIESGSLETVFTTLKSGLQSPMAGMATAFSSSLFGLAGSLVLGFLDLQAGQAQNRFGNELEDWLVGRAGTGLPGAVREGEGDVPAYIQALLEQTASNLETLERTLRHGEEVRTSANESVVQLAASMSVISEQMKLQHPQLSRLTDLQLEIKAVLDQMTALLSRPALGDAADDIRAHLLSIDNNLSRLLEEGARGRREMIDDLRNEIRILSRTLGAAVERPRQ